MTPSSLVRVSLDAPGAGQAVRLGDALYTAQGSPVVPATAAAYVSRLNQGPMVNDLFTFTNFPVTVTSVTTGRGVGGAAFFTFPRGFIRFEYCRALLTCSIAADQQANVTDGTPEGDIGIGTVAPANADALGTDATDDDFGTARTMDMTNYTTSALAVATEAAATLDGTSAAKQAFINMAIDAADIDDGASVIVLVNGWVRLGWNFQGYPA